MKVVVAVVVDAKKEINSNTKSFNQGPSVALSAAASAAIQSEALSAAASVVIPSEALSVAASAAILSEALSAAASAAIPSEAMNGADSVAMRIAEDNSLTEMRNRKSLRSLNRDTTLQVQAHAADVVSIEVASEAERAQEKKDTSRVDPMVDQISQGNTRETMPGVAGDLMSLKTEAATTVQSFAVADQEEADSCEAATWVATGWKKTGLVVMDVATSKIAHKNSRRTAKIAHLSTKDANSTQKILTSSKVVDTTVAAEASATEVVSKECAAEVAAICRCEDEDAVTTNSEVTVVAVISEEEIEVDSSTTRKWTATTRRRQTDLMTTGKKTTMNNERRTWRQTTSSDRQNIKDV